MANSSIFSPSLFWLVLGFLTSCASAPEYYHRTLNPVEKANYASLLQKGIGMYYQGSSSCQMLLEESRSLDSMSADVWRELGVPYLKRGFAVEFQHFYDHAVELDPAEWQGWRAYLYLYFYRDYERALVDLDATDILTPDFVDYPQAHSVDYMRGVCYYQLGKYKEALSYFNKHIEFEQENDRADFVQPIGYLFQVKTLEKLGREPEASKALEAAMKIHDRNADLWHWAAVASLERGEVAKATSQLQTAQNLYGRYLFNHRPYVEEFFQLYEPDFVKLKQNITNLH